MGLKEELISINNQINALNKRKSEVEKQLSKTLPFIEKFFLWYYNDDECEYDFLIGEKSHPQLRKLFDKIDEPRRGKTYDLVDLIGEDDFLIMEEPDGENLNENRAKRELINKYTPALKEAMQKKLKRFIADW